MSWWALALVLNPDVQKMAQAEIDAVVGRDRLPDFQDREHLPYVDAVYKEVLRWLPAVPQGQSSCAHLSAGLLIIDYR